MVGPRSGVHAVQPCPFDYHAGAQARAGAVRFVLHDESCRRIPSDRAPACCSAPIITPAFSAPRSLRSGAAAYSAGVGVIFCIQATSVANVLAESSLVSRNAGPAWIVCMALVSAVLMTAWDLTMDPVMSFNLCGPHLELCPVLDQAKMGHPAWVWIDGGPAFWVPLQELRGLDDHRLRRVPDLPLCRNENAAHTGARAYFAARRVFADRGLRHDGAGRSAGSAIRRSRTFI